MLRRASSAPSSALRRARNAQSQHRVRQRQRQAEEEKIAQVAAAAQANSEADAMRHQLLSRVRPPACAALMWGLVATYSYPVLPC